MMELQYLVEATHTLQTIAFACFILTVLYLLPHINYNAQLRKLPVFTYDGSSKRTTYLHFAKKLYRDGTQQFKDTVYRMATSDGVDTVVVAPRFLPELRKMPDAILSFPKAVEKLLEAKYTGVQTDEPIVAHTIKADLTPALFRLNLVICAEVEEAMKEEMPPCEDWTAVPIYKKLVNIVAKVSGRVFVGPELCRNEEYLDAGINYTMDLIGAQREIKKMKPWLRPFLAPRLPEVLGLRKREKDAKAFLDPIIKARQEASKKPGYEKPDDMLQWFINRCRSFGLESTQHMARIQLSIIFAAIHTTTMTATNILYGLAASPEYIPPLREEIRAAMADNEGIITSRALQQMEKLDSFMKETMRFYPLGFTAFSRRVLRGFTLSNGQYIPAGVDIEVPADYIHQDTTTYPDSDKFDGFRFYKLRQAGGATAHARNQFVTTNEQNLSFGYGAHACPGRFFAANEIKMILARAILEYDFKNVGGATERYKNFDIGRSSAPDPTKELLFKKVEG